MRPDDVVGPYRVLGKVGAGGMGEVYRALDTKLQREVAIKVLPDLFACDPERLARFAREARTLAALNHPHIAQVYGLEGPALVMELVDGEDLSQRISRSGRIPLEEGLPIALQIAEALEAAHEQGIIHRDLKPANIKVRRDGAVKVLDFGLAKAIDPGPGESRSLENSPTITSPFQMSQHGVILGTAAYMAPEQAKGKPVDKRADIWAFGCVLYEMLTGRRPFEGEDVTDTLAAIVRADPDWSALPPDTPPAVRTLLRRCLEKDRRERLPDIGAARLELRDARHGPAGTASVSPQRAASHSVFPWLIAGVAAAASLAAVAALVMRDRPPAPPPLHVYKSAIVLPATLNAAPALRFRVSHDGRRLAFIAPDQAGRNMLWIRPLDGLNAQPIAGTHDATAPFWSPDDRWIAFFAEGKLKKVDLSSGAIIALTDATGAPPGTWNRDDDILFTVGSSGLARVSASGGQPVSATEIRPGEQTHISPFFLPDGRHFLFSVSAAGASVPGVFLGSIESKERVKLLDVASNVAYANGHVLFLRDTTLMAQPFDPGTRTFTGAASPLAEGLQMNPASGTGAFSVSDTGVLLYQSGISAGTQLTWFDRSGKALSTLGEPRSYRDVQLSPDNTTVSVTVTTTGTLGDIWLIDVDQGRRRRFSTDQLTAAAIWSPDGRDLIYAGRRSGGNAPRDLFRRPANGSRAEELLFHDDSDKIPLTLSKDGRLVYRTATAVSAGELRLLPLHGERTPRVLVAGDRGVSGASISPDGQWLAYASNATGRREVFVTSFPDGNGRWQVSTEGGDNPVWRADGRELFFLSSGIIAVDVKPAADRFDTGPERRVLTVPVPAATLGTRSPYAVTRDGQKFLLNTWNTAAAVAPITLVVNWPETIKK